MVLHHQRPRNARYFSQNAGRSRKMPTTTHSGRSGVDVLDAPSGRLRQCGMNPDRSPRPARHASPASPASPACPACPACPAWPRLRSLMLACGVGALLVSTAAVPAVLRCIDVDGRVTYQDSSCPGGARGAPVDETPNKGFRFAEEKDIRRLRVQERESQGSKAFHGRVSSSQKWRNTRMPINAGERRFITAGTSAGEVRSRIGPPDHVDRPAASTSRSRSNGSTQRWVYHPAPDDPQTTTTLSIKGGIVLHVDRRITR